MDQSQSAFPRFDRGPDAGAAGRHRRLRYDHSLTSASGAFAASVLDQKFATFSGSARRANGRCGKQKASRKIALEQGVRRLHVEREHKSRSAGSHISRPMVDAGIALKVLTFEVVAASSGAFRRNWRGRRCEPRSTRSSEPWITGRFALRPGRWATNTAKLTWRRSELRLRRRIFSSRSSRMSTLGHASVSSSNTISRTSR
jgi:hypothetical protein